MKSMLTNSRIISAASRFEEITLSHSSPGFIFRSCHVSISWSCRRGSRCFRRSSFHASSACEYEIKTVSALAFEPGALARPTKRSRYRPMTKEDNWAARLVQGRRASGLSQVEAARQMGVVQCTLARWERGERQPSGEYAQRALRFLQGLEAAKPATAAAGRA